MQTNDILSSQLLFSLGNFQIVCIRNNPKRLRFIRVM